MAYSKIEIKKDRVIKTSDPQKMEIEIEKTLRAYEIGKKCGFFYVPRVFDYDKDKGVAVFERIKEVNPVENVLKWKDKRGLFIEKTGRALAVIHRELVLPGNMIIELPSEFRSPGTEVFIHGDFNARNVCVRSGSPPIIILDWQTTYHHGGEATYGSRYFDLVWFINYMLWTLKPKEVIRNPINTVAKQFLHAYFKETEFLYDPDALVLYFKRFFETKLQTRYQHASWQRRYLSNSLTKWFMKSLQSIENDDSI